MIIINRLTLFLILLEITNLSIVFGQELTPKEIFKKIDPSVVKIICFDYCDYEASQGSGVVINNNTIVTNFHVFKGMKSIIVKHYDKTYKNVEIIAADPILDLLVLRIKGNNLVRIETPKKKVEIGDIVYAIGSPKGFENSISDGIVSGIRTLEIQEYIQVTCPITHGSSGGAIVNSYGQLIGISTWGFNDGNLFFAIPIETIKDMKFSCINNQTSLCHKKLYDYLIAYNHVKSMQYKKAYKEIKGFFNNYGNNYYVLQLFFEVIFYVDINDDVISYIEANPYILGKSSKNLIKSLKKYKEGAYYLAAEFLIKAINQDSHNGYYFYFLSLIYLKTYFPVYRMVSYLRQAEKYGVSAAGKLRFKIENTFLINENINLDHLITR